MIGNKRDNQRQVMQDGGPSSSLPVLDNLQPWQLRVLADDDGLLPVIDRGDPVVIDCSDRELVDGEIYAVRDQSDVRFWLYRHGYDGVGFSVGGVAVGTLSSLAGTFRCEPVLERHNIQIVGRCIGRLGGEIADNDRLVRLEGERRALLEASNRLVQHVGAPKVSSSMLPDDVAGMSPPALRLWIERSLNDPSFSRRFAFEQELDAIASRLMFIEDVMSRGTATSLAGIKAQLDMLWDVNYERFPEDAGELCALTIDAARRSLHQMTHPASAGLPESDEQTGAPIKIVRSPRQTGL